MLEQLAYLHGAPTARGILKAEAADFVVNEDLGFEPCGEGEHIFVRVRTTGENTAWVAGLLADAAGPRLKKALHAVSPLVIAVIGAVIARWSWVSCRLPHPLPRLAVLLTLEITNIGIESA